jgi:polysaccharide deacetylase 2 family uncharacterized protein YibQ
MLSSMMKHFSNLFFTTAILMGLAATSPAHAEDDFFIDSSRWQIEPRPEKFFAENPAMPLTGNKPQAVAVAVAKPEAMPTTFAPVEALKPTAKIAVVIDDMGVVKKYSKQAIALNGALTLSFLPYADDLPAQTAAAKAAGHELMVHIPMQPMGNANTGINALTTTLSAEELQRRIDWNFSQFSGFVGMNNHMGSKFTQDRALLQPVMLALKKQGGYFLDSRTTPKSVAGAVAAENGLATLNRDVFLDDVDSLAAVEKQLAHLEKIALKTGQAVAIGHPRPNTLNALRQWLPTLASKQITLVPLSHLMLKKTHIATAESVVKQ